MKFSNLTIQPGRYLTLGGDVVEILSVSGTAACGRYLGFHSVMEWRTNGWWDVLGGSHRDLVARLPVNPDACELAAVIRGFWRCANGQLVRVRDVGIGYATGVAVVSDEMHWGTFTGKLIDGLDNGWDLDRWLGFAPENGGEE